MGDLRLWLSGLLLCLSLEASGEIEAYPGSQLINSSSTGEVRIHRVITGEVKRVNGEIRPESSDYVRGIKRTSTYEVVDVRRSEVISGFFKRQVQSLGQILFECEGRGCGTSNYWANTVFGQSILYGPTEDQHYFLSKLNGDRGDYVVIYLAQRATGKRYAHVEVISDTGGDRIVDSRLITSALRLQNRFVIDNETDPSILEAIRAVVNEGDWNQLGIVAHDALGPNENIEAAQTRTLKRAQGFKRQLEEMGVDTRKVRAVGAGPIAPIDRSNRRRLELVLLR